MLPRTLADAICAGTYLYFDGSTCSNGHVAPRRWGFSYLKGRQRVTTKCEECRRANRAAHRAKDIAAQHRSLINSRLSSLLAGRPRRKRTSKAETLLGCSIEHYKAHIESAWNVEMTWENYGTHWEVDHIQPCHTFDLTDAAQLHACFHYTNTRPLERTKNAWRGS